jgi:hypothetical protein|nr:MAG TPA: hypothetical protein [Caudoviricetes sp.]
MHTSVNYFGDLTVYIGYQKGGDMRLENKSLYFTFGIDDVNVIEDDDRFAITKIRAFAEKENSHTQPISFDSLKMTANTIYNVPVVVEFTDWNDDGIGTHSKAEIPVGFVYSENNPVTFEYDEERDKNFLTIKALIWKNYSKNIVDIIHSSNDRKKVSVEMTTTDYQDNGPFDKPDVYSWKYQAITILSDQVAEACKGSNVQLMKFSEDKENYIKENFADKISIDNSKEAATSGEWSNPGQKLFKPITEASNAKSLLKEAYLIGDFSDNEYEITKFKYPHHVVRDGKLIVHKDGLQSAFSRAAQQGIVKGDVKSHLLKHYRELGLDTQNFAEFGFSQDEFNQYFAEDYKQDEGENVEEEKKVTEAEVTETKKEDETKVEEAEAAEEKTEEKVEEACETETITESYETEMGSDKKMADDEDDKDDDSDERHDESDKDDDDNKENMSLEEAMSEISNLTAENEKLKKDNEAYMAKFEAMSDYDELKAFKFAAEEKEKQEANMVKMCEVLDEISEKGVEMSEDERNAYIAKFSEYDSVAAWSNMVKAAEFDRVGAPSGNIHKIGLPYGEKKKSTGSIWDN